jgi:hypothetical protein
VRNIQQTLDRALWHAVTNAQVLGEPAERGAMRLKQLGGLGLMVESGLCDSFESRLARWHGMAEGDPEMALQALTEMASVGRFATHLNENAHPHSPMPALGRHVEPAASRTYDV